MIRHAIAFVLFCLAAPPLSFAFDDASFCKEMSAQVAAMKSMEGHMYSAKLRHDRVTIDCTAKEIVYHQSLLTPASELPAGWMDKKQASVNATSCGEAKTREAVQNGWKITTTVDTADKQQLKAQTVCK